MALSISTGGSFLWKDGSLFDVNGLIAAKSGFYITQAFVINDRGAIGGIGTSPGCDFDEDCGHAYVLVPCDSDDENNDLECKEAAQSAIVSARMSGPANSRTLQALTRMPKSWPFGFAPVLVGLEL